jgi:hypothetical protein
LRFQVGLGQRCEACRFIVLNRRVYTVILFSLSIAKVAIASFFLPLFPWLLPTPSFELGREFAGT